MLSSSISAWKSSHPSRSASFIQELHLLSLGLQVLQSNLPPCALFKRQFSLSFLTKVALKLPSSEPKCFTKSSYIFLFDSPSVFPQYASSHAVAPSAMSVAAAVIPMCRRMPNFFFVFMSVSSFELLCDPSVCGVASHLFRCRALLR